MGRFPAGIGGKESSRFYGPSEPIHRVVAFWFPPCGSSSLTMFAFRAIRQLLEAILYFFSHLESEGMEAGQPTGRWAGRGAEMLGLKAGSPVEVEQFSRLCRNRHPVTGEKLGVRDSAGRRAYHDFVLAAPKSVSIEILVHGNELLLQCLRDHWEWFIKQLEERNGTRVRIEGQNTTRLTSNAIMGVFEHSRTRQGDPYKHLHVAVLGNTWDEVEQRWKAAEVSAIANDWAYLNDLANHDLARRVAALGYELEWNTNGFELARIAPEVRELFSKRSAHVKTLEEEIKAEAEQLARRVLEGQEPDSVLTTRLQWRGKDMRYLKMELIRRLAWRLWSRVIRERESGEAAAGQKQEQESLTKAERTTLFRESRQRKSQVPPTDQASWQEELKRAKLSTGGGNPSPAPASSYRVQDSVVHAIEHLAERSTVVTMDQLVRAGIRHARERASLDEIKAAFQGHPDLLFSESGEVAFQKHLAEEKELIRWVAQGRNAAPPLCRLQPRVAGRSFNEEQEEAARQILASTDRVIRFRGGAGTGKTTTLKVIYDTLSADKREVLVLAPTKQAVEELRARGIPQVRSLQSLLEHPDNALSEKVIILDEASLVSVRGLTTLKRLADQATNVRVVLSGDERQFHSVEYGDGLRLIDRFSGARVVELTTILRQTEANYREVVRLSAEGNNSMALQRLIEMKAVEVTRGPASQRAATCYVRSLTESGQAPLVVTPTWAEARRATEAIREQLKQTCINSRFPVISQEETPIRVFEDLSWTLAERKDIGGYKAGLQVQFTRSIASFVAAECVSILEVKAGEGTLVVKRENGQRSEVPVKHAVNYSVGQERIIPVARGDKLLMRANLASHGLINGSIVTVAAVKPEGIEVERGKKRLLIPPHFHGFTQGFAIPTQRAQGASCQHLIQVAEYGSNAVHREQFYVAISRGVEKITVITSDLAALKRRIDESSLRTGALELVENSPALNHHRMGLEAGVKIEPGMGMKSGGKG